MRAFIAALVLFSLILGGIVVNSIYVCAATDGIAKYTRLTESAENKAEAFLTLKNYWKKHQRILRLTAAEAKIEHMNELMASLELAISTRNLPEISRVCTVIYELCDDISLYERISFQGIF